MLPFLSGKTEGNWLCNETIKLVANDFIHHSRGYVYLKKGEYEKAVADFTESLRLNVKSTDAYKDRAKAYRALGKVDLAEADEKKTKELGQ